MRWLFDVIAIVASIWWRRTRVRPGLRLVTGSAAPAPVHAWRRGRVGGVITVLVSHRDMEARLRSALGSRAVLRFTTTWADLERVIAGTQPLAVFADPMADRNGDPDGHLARFARDLGLRVILYTTLTPELAGRLNHLGQAGIHYAVFHRLDDRAERLNDFVDSQPPPPPRQPPLFAA